MAEENNDENNEINEINEENKNANDDHNEQIATHDNGVQLEVVTLLTQTVDSKQRDDVVADGGSHPAGHATNIENYAAIATAEDDEFKNGATAAAVSDILTYDAEPISNNLHDPQNSDGIYMKSTLNGYDLNYWLIIAITLGSASFGLLIYILTDLWWVVLACAGLGLIVSSIKEYYEYYKSKQAPDMTEDKTEIQHELEEGFVKWKENKDEDAVYVETQFDNSYIETVNDGKKKRKRNVNITGSTRVYNKNDSGVLMIEKRALYTFQDYKGYEIGGGLSSLAGFSITIIVQIIKIIIDSQSDGEVDWALNIFILLFITFALLCVGCIIEIELRKTNVLPPNKKLYLTATSIALHEIKSLDRHSATNYQNVTSELNKHGGAPLTMKKIAIKWFQSLFGIYKLIQWIFIALYINTPFVMFIPLCIAFGLLFDLTVNKSNSAVPNETILIMIFCWIAVAIGAFGIYYTSKGIAPDDIHRFCKRLSTEDRIEASEQRSLWILLLIASILLVIAVIMITALDVDVYNRQIDIKEGEELDASTRILEKMYCVSNLAKSNTKDESAGYQSDYNNTVNSTKRMRRMQDRYLTDLYDYDYEDYDVNDVYEMDPYCARGRKYVLNFALYFVWIAWALVLYGSYYWKQYDRGIFNFDIRNNSKMQRVWKRYSVINIGLKTRKKSSHFTSLFGGSGESVINVELDPDEATKLHAYLNTVVPWFKAHTFVPHQLYSKIDYNQNVIKRNEQDYVSYY